MTLNLPTLKTCQTLLTPNLPPAQIQQHLRPLGFKDCEAAYNNLHRLGDTPEAKQILAYLLPPLFAALVEVGNPDQIIVGFDRFARVVPDRLDLFRTLINNPRIIEILVTLFAGSQFLTQILLRTPAHFQRLATVKNLGRVQSYTDFYTSATQSINRYSTLPEKLDALRRFQRWQLLRIGMADLVGLFDLATITRQLSHLADSLVQLCLNLAATELNTTATGFVVLGMGKLGGQELNYSSDIDLIFISSEQGSNYAKLSKQLIDYLTRATTEGFLYRVDMRLRPWGKVGALVTSVEGYIAYLNKQARLWEKQALLKARPIAGDKAVGESFLNQITPLIFASAGQTVQADVHAMKQKIEKQLRKHGRDWGEVKLGEGSIRDIEFATQYLQLAHGDTHPEIHSRNTLESLNRLHTHNLLNQDEYRILTDGYRFLRAVEHWLQMMHYRQTHTLPTATEELNTLARRLGFQDSDAGEQFLARYQQHTIAIRLVYQSHLNPQKDDTETAPKPKTDSFNVQKHLARLTPDYANTFNQTDIEHHALLANRLNLNNLVEVETKALADGHWQITIVGYDYLGELSIICGLFLAYQCNILEGHVFTYRPAGKSGGSRKQPAFYPASKHPFSKSSPPTKPQKQGRQKIVDVFIVEPQQANITTDFWLNYTTDLNTLLQQLEAGKRDQAQSTLLKRLAVFYEKTKPTNSQLYPVDIKIDNTLSTRSTVLQIESRDTMGFLYELTNALALKNVYIARVSIESEANKVHDILYVTDAMGKKITDTAKLRELRAATVLTKHFTHLLPHSPNPESALRYFRQFLVYLFNRPNWPDELASLENTEVLDALARLLGVSDFLWTDFLRMQYANLFPVVQNVAALINRKSKADLQKELDACLQDSLASTDEIPYQTALNAFKDREMFRIDMRHILGHITQSGQFSAELSDLAEVVLATTYRLCIAELTAQFGQPALKNGHPCPISVCALGKCGGRELGFASDIEVIFIYGGNGKTTGSTRIPTAEFYEKLVQNILKTIQAKREGIFELDLRLRPYGKNSSMAVSYQSFQEYYAPDGPAWAYERQALVKLRPIAGNMEFGQQIVTLRDKIVYNQEAFDVTAMRGMRERQVRHLVTPGTINAKHTPGGLVDIEYLIQGLQITHGYNHPELRLTNTHQAMTALAEVGILPFNTYTQLREALIFLRRLINALRMVHGHAKDLTVPAIDSDAFAFLARRLNYGTNLTALNDDLVRHLNTVQEINAQFLQG